MKVRLKDCSVCIKKEVILRNLNFELEKGKFYHLVGENGAGKSVFLQSLLGLTPFASGEYDIHYDKDELCYITSIPFYFDNEKVVEVMKLLTGLYKVELSQFADILEYLQLEYEKIKSKRMNELSQGTRQKIVVLPLFLQGLQFYVLDEIFAGFDIGIQEKIIIRLLELAKQQKTVLFVEHNAELMEKLTTTIDMEGLLCKNQTIIKN